jgi:ribosomal protein S11
MVKITGRYALKKYRVVYKGDFTKKDHFFLPNNTAKLYLNRSYTNIFITLTDMQDRVIICKSAGNSEPTQHSKRYKIIPQAIETICEKLHFFFDLYSINKVLIVLKIKKNILFDYLLKELDYYFINVIGIQIRRTVAFNGVRSRKARRV